MPLSESFSHIKAMFRQMFKQNRDIDNMAIPPNPNRSVQSEVLKELTVWKLHSYVHLTPHPETFRCS